MKGILTVILTIFFLQNTKAQQPYLVKKISEKITLDGNLDEEIWKTAKPVGQFWEYFPKDTIRAKYNTDIFIAYDDKNIYLAAKAYSKGNKYIIPSLRRDFRAGGNDNVTFIFDTFHDNTNGFVFGTNPYGVQREALVFNGGTDNSFMNFFWDNKWQSEAKIFDNYYTCEMIIPLSTLRFKENSKLWNFKSYRFDTQANENSSLNQMPQSIIIMSMGFTTPIEFEEPLKKTSSNISIIPYVSGIVSKDFERKSATPNKLNIGGDAKIAVTSGLNLDLTVNPDFSTVEADRQVVNLTRFDITFPEQRQFFIENSDLFTGFGSYNTNPFFPPTSTVVSGSQIYSPFFSRKIGIALDSTTGTNVQTPILYGARLSGKIDDNWRIGLMNTQTGKDDDRGIRSTNYSVGALTRRVFDRSNISAIFVNKKVIDAKETDKGLAYNSVVGLEYNLQSVSNKWQGKLFYHQAFTPTIGNDKIAHGASLNYISNKMIAKMSYEYLGKNFSSEAGFVPRNNFFHFSPTIGFNIFPNSKVINRFSYGFSYDQYNLLGFGKTDLQAGPFVLFSFQNTARILANLNRNETYLFNDFDALRANGQKPILKKGTSYTYTNINATFVTDSRKPLSLAFQPLIGQYYDGSIISLRGEANYRFQPYCVLSMNFNYNNIKLKSGENEVVVFGPKADVTFKKNLFWTTFVQYNSQFKNMNVNSRLQWRFAPVSDFYIVYSDNYDTGLWGAKNRAILAKATYWLNI
jgi:hypothetical protein